MTTEVASNAWGHVIRHDLERILELRWLDSSVRMSDDDFKATLELFAAEQERARLPSLLIDATEFRHEFGEGVMEWRDREIIPRYSQAGSVRLAFHVPAGCHGSRRPAGCGGLGHVPHRLVRRAPARPRLVPRRLRPADTRPPPAVRVHPTAAVIEVLGVGHPLNVNEARDCCSRPWHRTISPSPVGERPR